jgi:hypothetical protein
MTLPSTQSKTEPLQIPLLELPPSPESPPASKPSANAAAVGKTVGSGRRYQRGAFDPRQEMPPPRVADFVSIRATRCAPLPPMSTAAMAVRRSVTDFAHPEGGALAGGGNDLY